MESYFFGIIGHLRDAQGQPLDSWDLCSKLANYWQEWFGIPTHGATSSAPEPTPPPIPVAAEPEIPRQILQVAWFLMSVINQNPTVKCEPHPGSLSDANRASDWFEWTELGSGNFVSFECSVGYLGQHSGSKPRSSPKDCGHPRRRGQHLAEFRPEASPRDLAPSGSFGGIRHQRASSKKAPLLRGVCVKHLNRCKTSFQTKPNRFLQGGNLMFAADFPTKRAAFMTDMTLGRWSHVSA